MEPRQDFLTQDPTRLNGFWPGDPTRAVRWAFWSNTWTKTVAA